jgi:glycosyltransferase involved in cell wall biosynthesis
MRILDVSPRICNPPHRGGHVRTYNLLRQLALHHDVRQFSHAKYGDVRQKEPLESGYEEYHFRNWIAERLGEVSEAGWPAAPILAGFVLQVTRPRVIDELIEWSELILVEFPWQFSYVHERAAGKRVIYCSHNVEKLKFESYGAARGVKSPNGWLRYIERLERRAVLDADLIIAVSDADRDAFVDTYGTPSSNIAVVENGSDTERHAPVHFEERSTYRKALGLPELPTVIYVAGSAAPPQVAGVRWVKELAATMPEFMFVVVGAVSAKSHERPNLMCTGYVPDHTPFLRAADYALCPIQFGGGTKMKLFEYMAFGLPTLVFAEALWGTQIKADEEVLVVPKSTIKMAAALRDLSRDVDACELMSKLARRRVVERHGWDRLGSSLDSAISSLGCG